MGKIGKSVLAIMLILAIGNVCFGIGMQQNFFVTLESSIAPLNNVAGYALKVVDFIFDTSLNIEADEKVIVNRFFFEDGKVYCDIVSSINLVPHPMFAYSNNPDIVGYYRFHILKSPAEGLFTVKFTDRYGQVAYESSLFTRYYTLHGKTYGEYRDKYQKNDSVEGWI